MEKQFTFLFEQLNIRDTADVVKQFVHPAEIHQPLPSGAVKAVKAESTEGLAD